MTAQQATSGPKTSLVISIIITLAAASFPMGAQATDVGQPVDPLACGDRVQCNWEAGRSRYLCVYATNTTALGPSTNATTDLIFVLCSLDNKACPPDASGGCGCVQWRMPAALLFLRRSCYSDDAATRLAGCLQARDRLIACPPSAVHLVCPLPRPLPVTRTGKRICDPVVPEERHEEAAAQYSVSDPFMALDVTAAGLDPVGKEANETKRSCTATHTHTELTKTTVTQPSGSPSLCSTIPTAAVLLFAIGRR